MFYYKQQLVRQKNPKSQLKIYVVKKGKKELLHKMMLQAFASDIIKVRRD
jgi:hypothetical protein